MSSSERIRLQAQAHDALTEVLVTNSQFDRVARGFGSVTIELDPGVHRVEFRTGTQAEEKYVVLRSLLLPASIRIRPSSCAPGRGGRCAASRRALACSPPVVVWRSQARRC
jgi:hypothetical protein